MADGPELFFQYVFNRPVAEVVGVTYPRRRVDPSREIDSICKNFFRNIAVLFERGSDRGAEAAYGFKAVFQVILTPFECVDDLSAEVCHHHVVLLPHHVDSDEETGPSVQTVDAWSPSSAGILLAEIRHEAVVDQFCQILGDRRYAGSEDLAEVRDAVVPVDALAQDFGFEPVVQPFRYIFFYYPSVHDIFLHYFSALPDFRPQASQYFSISSRVFPVVSGTSFHIISM